MTYAAQETSRYGARPVEMYLFQTASESWRHTSSDTPRVHLGQIYTPEAIERTEIDQNSETNSGSIKVTIPRSHDLASRFVSYIPSTPLSLVIYRTHDADPDGEVVVNFTGRVASATFNDFCELNVVPEQDALRRRVPVPKFQTQCNRVHYGPGCDLDPMVHRYPATIATLSADGLTLTGTGFGLAPAGRLAAGYIQKGDVRSMILTHSGTTITLISAVPGLAVGDPVEAFLGCQRSEADCAYFNNLVNFFGFSRIPTRNPFDGME